MSARDNEMFVELVQTALSYARSQVLMTANELGVFTLIDKGSSTAGEIAGLTGSSADYVERLLNCCVATGLLRKTNGHYKNLPVAEKFLVEGKERYMGNWIKLMADWYRPWGSLSTAIRTGEPAEDPLAKLGKDAEYTHHFIMAMNDYAMAVGREMVKHLDLTGCKTLLDVGGGSGAYSVLLALENPQLNAVVFDLPPVLEIASEVIQQHGVSDRVSVQPGNYYEDDLGSEYDVVLLSNILHQEDPNSCKVIMRKAYRALKPGGRVVVQAMFLNENKDGPVWPAIHSLLLLLVYKGGRAYSFQETMDMLQEVGFQQPKTRRMSLFNAESLIIATKP